MEKDQIKMANNPREPLLTIPDLEQTVGMHFAFVVPLINRGMFPQPVHMKPPLWREKAVKAWHRKVVRSG